MADSSQCPETFLALITVDDTLHAIDKSGNSVPLFVYGPLRDAYTFEYSIEFAPNWPSYVSGFVMLYNPFPVLRPDQIQDNLENDISHQKRDGTKYIKPDEKRKWHQLIYRGWPLYYVNGVNQLANAEGQPIMFEPAVFEMPRPTDPIGTPPGNQLGP